VTAETPARDALAGRAAELAEVNTSTGARITIEHLPFLAQVSLRLDPSLAGRAPYPLPLEPNSAWEDGPRSALWLGPDEWLVLGPAHTAPEIVAELDRALDGEHRSIVDISANRVAIELGGRDRSELLVSGCSLDLHQRSWRAGMCAQTLFAKTQVILHERDAATTLLVRPSFAGYLVDRLLAGL
jgi:sarcosine oxidase subunit gamma